LATELNARDLKLVQYLNEAYGKEKELETALTADISMTTDKTYRKRLQDHLKETRDHARRVKSRIKAIGGRPEEVPVPGPDAVSNLASGAVNLANRAVAAAKGPAHTLRGTGEQEKLLKNVKSQYWNEFEEIATYTAIETLADTVGDKETAKLAREIRRDEERMAKFLERLIPRFTKGVAREEIPAALRNGNGGRSRRKSSSRRGSTSRSTKSRARSAAKGARSAAKTARTSARAAKTSAKRSRAGAKGGRKRAKSGSRS
jgi:ferritin-like metal-binding protein YciE